MDYKAYYQLVKPGIIYANVITALAGYLLASRFKINLSVLLCLLIGTGLVIGGACSYNNVLDRSLDRRMQRTQQRALLTGAISPLAAMLFASSLTVSGLLLLLVTQNWLTTLLIAIALVDYVLLYGYGKRHSAHGTLIGCLAGAIPLVAGYCAVTARIDVGAWLLFALMVCWQMAHFFGIALYRLRDYQAAGIPVMPAVHGVKSTQRQTLVYIIAFGVVGILLGVYGYIGLSATILLVIISSTWFVKAARWYGKLPSAQWGRQVFLFSLAVMLVMSVSLAIGPLLA